MQQAGFAELLARRAARLRNAVRKQNHAIARGQLLGAAQLSPGDRVVLFTDGVTEACSPAGEEFGETRLLHLLEDHRALSADELQAKILAVVAEFCGGRWQDDATLLVLAVDAQRHGNGDHLQTALEETAR